MSRKWIEGIIKKQKDNNQGIALVTAIVCIGFVAALVSIILTTSLVNFKMKAVNTKSKDTFYSAEQALDEINIYLQKVVSDCMSSAYLDIMNNYSTYDSQKKTELLETKYYENLWTELGVQNAGGAVQRDKYDVKKLENYLKDSTVWHYAPGADEDYYGAIIMAEVADPTDPTGEKKIEQKAGKMVTYAKSGVVLEGLKVYYKDEKGFVSVVKTDIRLSYPEFDFAASSELPSLPYYSIIADEQAQINSSKSATLSGNLYANELTIKGGNSSGEKVNVKTSDDDTIIVKYDINIRPNTVFSTGSGVVVWAKDVIVDSSSAEFDGTLQVADDFNLRGTSPSTKISGEYVGFGNSLTDGANSSAILINGTGTSLDLSGVDKFTIAGHGFIGASDSEYPTASSFAASNTNKNTFNADELAKAQDLATAKNNDFLMGESLAVKSDQLMYLVPAEAIAVNKKTGRTTDLSKNPMTFKEYEKLQDLIKNPTAEYEYEEVASDVQVSSLGTDLSIYLATKLLNKKVVPDVEKVFVRVTDENSGGGLVYFYMKFTNVNKAEKFFTAYYNNNKEVVQKYMNSYLSEVDIHAFNTLTTVANAGPVLIGDQDDEEGFDIEIGRQSSDSDYMQKIHDKYYDKYKSLCTSLVAKNDTVASVLKPVGFAGSFEDDVAEKQVIFENIVSEDLLKEFVDNIPTTPGVAYNDTDESAATVAFNKVGNTVYIYDKAEFASYGMGAKPYGIISNDNIEITIEAGSKFDNLVLVIAKGNVTINRSQFKGLVLSNGIVKVNAAEAEVQANPGEVRKVLAMGYFNTSLSDKSYTVARVLREGNEFIYSSLDPKGDTANLALGGLISYENWSKE